jgi:hypothetical protein
MLKAVSHTIMYAEKQGGHRRGIAQLDTAHVNSVRPRTNKTKRIWQSNRWTGDGLQLAGRCLATLALRQCTPPGRTRSRWAVFVDDLIVEREDQQYAA